MSISNLIITDATIISLINAAVPIGNQITSLQAMVTQAQNDIIIWQQTLTSLTAQYATIQADLASRLLQLGVPS